MRMCPSQHDRNTVSFAAGTSTKIFAAIGLVVLWGAQVRGQFVNTLPRDVKRSILWVGDSEEGNLSDWKRGGGDAGGGVFNTGRKNRDVISRATTEVAHSGKYSAEATIKGAYRTKNGNRAVRLMRWTDRPWFEGGDYFPTEAYYSTWMYFKENYNPNKYPPHDPFGDGGWFNVFQFKAHDKNGESLPVFVLNVGHNDDNGHMYFYLYSNNNKPHSFSQKRPKRIRPKKWTHVEAYYRVSNNGNGSIHVWQDGKKILKVENVDTTLAPDGDDQFAIWGIGAYTNHIAGGSKKGKATIFFDDCIVSTRRISRYI